MVFKIKPVLTPRQLRRAKWTTGFASALILFLGSLSHFTDAASDERGPITWNDEDWYNMDV